MLIAEDQDHAAERYALEHGIADECGTAFDKAEDADLIILATPVSVIAKDLCDFPSLKRNLEQSSLMSAARKEPS